MEEERYFPIISKEEGNGLGENAVQIDAGEQEEELPKELWVTVNEFLEVNAVFITRSKLYRLIAKGKIRSRMEKGKYLVCAETPPGVARILLARERRLQKPEEPRRTHTINIEFPVMLDARRSGILDHTLKTLGDNLDEFREMCKKVTITYKRRLVGIDNEIYKTLESIAKAQKVTVKTLVTHAIYTQIINEGGHDTWT